MARNTHVYTYTPPNTHTNETKTVKKYLSVISYGFFYIPIFSSLFFIVKTNTMQTIKWIA